MNPRTGGPKSFNTIKRSHREDRRQRRRQARMVLLGVIAMLLLLALTGLIFLICQVVTLLGAGTPNEPDGNDPSTPAITYQMLSKSYADVYAGELIVVRQPSQAYHFPAVESLQSIIEGRQKINGSPVYIVPNVNNPPKLQPAAAAAFNNMMAQYYSLAGGTPLTAYKAYRTYEQQEGHKTPAGYSEHHTGLLIAITNDEKVSALDLTRHSWLLENCHSYGFIQRYPSAKAGTTGINYDYSEAFRYVGIPHASYIAANGLCLEEYINLLRDNHTSTGGSDGKHLAIDVNKDNIADYEVYYVLAKTGEDALTAVPVPIGYDYTVSGDNSGGFIVTVTLKPAQNPAA